MGIGFALTETRILDRSQTGKMVNANWHDYKIPTAMDVPADLACVPIDPRRHAVQQRRSEGAGRAGHDTVGRGNRERRVPRHGAQAHGSPHDACPRAGITFRPARKPDSTPLSP